MHISVRKCEEAIKINASLWPCRCNEIARLILREVPGIKGHSRYGLYLGYIADSSPFRGRSLARHGWIERPRGGIIDPTRWVFEDVKPYIFVCGRKHECIKDYDVGAARVRSALGFKEFPAHCGKPVQINWPQSCLRWLRKTCGTTELSVRQVHWLATRPPNELGPYAKAIYQTLITAEKGYFIPLDFRQAVLNDCY